MKLNSADYKQLEKEVEKREKEYGDTYCHYTSLNAFLNMVKSREIWMTSTGTMNDRKEITYFIEMLENELTEYSRNDFFTKVYDQIPLNYKYAFCLSASKDDVGQWERYADSATGVCLSFNLVELCKCLYGNRDIIFNKVFYEESVKNNKYLEIVKKYFETNVIDVYSSEEELIRMLIHAGNLHKHKSFRCENEIRISTLDNIKQYGTKYELKEIGNVVKKVLVLKPDIMGQAMGTCFEMLIDEVIIGPKSQQNINVLQQYLRSCGLSNLAEKVTISDCPLR